MKVDWNETIAGLSMLEVREVARKLFDAQDLEWLAAKSGMSQATTRSVVKAMTRRGWLHTPETGVYQTTIAGNALAMAKKLPALPRAKAEALLAKVITTATAINQNPDMAHDVTYLGVFGSFLSDAASLSDLDITYELTPRWQQHDHDTFVAMGRRTAKAYPPPRSIGLMIYSWPEMLAKNMLTVSKQVSLHERSEIAALGWRERQMFTARPTRQTAEDVPARAIADKVGGGSLR